MVHDLDGNENQSFFLSIFLKLRKYNQAIIIRDASKQLKIEDDVTVNVDGINYTGPSWSVDGLTVTMWVRFLNSTTGGSLMTYGNPMMKKLPGFDNHILVENYSLSDKKSDKTVDSRFIVTPFFKQLFIVGDNLTCFICSLFSIVDFVNMFQSY